MRDNDNPPDGERPDKDLSKMFDLDRSNLTTSMVSRFEDCFRQQESAAADVVELTNKCNGLEFSKRDIAAMKKIAKLRLKDKRADASEQLEALSRISRAVNFDLFDWSEKTRGRFTHDRKDLDDH
jgi:hypothetical protein